MERRSPLTQISKLRAQELLLKAGLKSPLRSMHGFDTGLSNTCLRLDLENQSLVLKIYRRAEIAHKERALALILSDDIPCPKILSFGDLEDAKDPSQGHCYALFELAPGRPLSQLAITEAQWPSLGQQLGQTLARIHARGFEQAGDLQAQASPPSVLQVVPWGFDGGSFIEHCLRETPAAQRVPAALQQRLRVYCQDCDQRWPELHKLSQLVHSDFNPSNIMVVEDGAALRVSAILDWEFAHAGEPMMDLGNLLRLRPQWQPPPSFSEALEHGARAAGACWHPEWRQQAAYIDLSSALEFLSSVKDKPERHAQCLKQLEMTLELER